MIVREGLWRFCRNILLVSASVSVIVGRLLELAEVSVNLHALVRVFVSAGSEDAVQGLSSCLVMECFANLRRKAKCPGPKLLLFHELLHCFYSILHFAVFLRVLWAGRSMGKFSYSLELFKLVRHELRAVIRNYGEWDPLPCKVLFQLVDDRLAS